MHKFKALGYKARKILLHLAMGCGVLAGSGHAWAFSTTNPFTSLVRGLYTLNDGQSAIFAAFESGSFNDVFSKLEGLGTVTVTRFLKAPQEVNLEKVRKHIDDVYPELPPETRQLLAARMAETLKADAILQARMNEPAIGDDLMLMFAQERKRLHTSFFEYQSKIVDEHQQLVKPAAYARFRQEAGDRALEFDDLVQCELYQCNTDSADVLARIQENLRSRPENLERLLRSPVEVTKPTEADVRIFMQATQSAGRSLDQYLSSLYSPQP